MRTVSIYKNAEQDKGENEPAFACHFTSLVTKPVRCLRNRRNHVIRAAHPAIFKSSLHSFGNQLKTRRCSPSGHQKGCLLRRLPADHRLGSIFQSCSLPPELCCSRALTWFRGLATRLVVPPLGSVHNSGQIGGRLRGTGSTTAFVTR